MNILILSCGTRNKLVSFFVESEAIDKVVVTDCSVLAPALYIADKYYIVPRMNEAGYFDAIIDICKQEDIDMVLPLQEDELVLTALNKSRYEEIGVIPVVSDYDKVILCRDKYELSRWLEDHNIPCVKTMSASEYLDSINDYGTAYIKPRYGAGSVNTFFVHSKHIIQALVDDTKEDFIVQPLMKGREFGVDTYVDLVSKEVVISFVKEKLRMRAGETEKSVSVINKEIEELAVNAIREIGLVGPIDMDIMENEGKYYILEINPRFGGGYPHAYACGVKFTDFLSNNCAGKCNEVKRNDYPGNVLAMKYSDIIVKNI